MRVLVPALCLVILGSAAARADDCPTKETATAGFVLEGEGKRRIAVRAQPGPLVESALYDGDKKVETATYFEGYFPLEQMSDQVTFRLKPPGELGGFFPLKADAKISVVATPSLGGKPGKPWTVDLSVIGTGSHKIGDCSYPVWRIARKVTEEGGRVVDEAIDFFNDELRFVIGREVAAPDGKTRTQTYVRIRPRGRSGPL